jgi:hypothetical protein
LIRRAVVRKVLEFKVSQKSFVVSICRKRTETRARMKERE